MFVCCVHRIELSLQFQLTVSFQIGSIKIPGSMNCPMSKRAISRELQRTWHQCGWMVKMVSNHFWQTLIQCFASKAMDHNILMRISGGPLFCFASFLCFWLFSAPRERDVEKACCWCCVDREMPFKIIEDVAGFDVIVLDTLKADASVEHRDRQTMLMKKMNVMIWGDMDWLSTWCCCRVSRVFTIRLWWIQRYLEIGQISD